MPVSRTCPEGTDHQLNGHLVAGQRPRLIKTDHRCLPQSPNRAELLDDGMVPGHALHAQGKGNLNHIRPGWVHEDEVIHSVLPPGARPASGNMPSLIDCSCLESLANPVMPRSSQRFGGLLEEIKGGETKTLCGYLPSRNHNIHKHSRNHQSLHPHGNLPLHTA